MINGAAIALFPINGPVLVTGAAQTTSVALQVTLARDACRWVDTSVSATSWDDQALPSTTWTGTTTCE